MRPEQQESSKSYRWHACAPCRVNLPLHSAQALWSTHPLLPKPGSGAHGSREQLTALGGMFASKHALAECVAQHAPAGEGSAGCRSS